jgi:hypothetical protein
MIQHRAAECAMVPGARIPHAVQRRKTRRRQRLVDRRPALHPGKAASRFGGVGGEEFRERIVEELRMGRSAAVMQQRYERLDAVLREQGEPPLRPRIIAGARAVALDVLPKHRIAARGHAERGEPFDIALAPGVPRLLTLIAIRRRIEPRDRRFGRRPNLDIARAHATVSAASSATLASAEATT